MVVGVKLCHRVHSKVQSTLVVPCIESRKDVLDVMCKERKEIAVCRRTGVCEQCDTTGVRLVWNVVGSLPKLVRVYINLLIIGCALVVFLCVTLFRVTVAVIYVILLCLVAALLNAVNDDDV
jgi:hypothetical protein